MSSSLDIDPLDEAARFRVRTSSTVAIAILLLVALLPAGPASADSRRWGFQSNFWVSLHETLLQASKREPIPEAGTLEEADGRAWRKAVDFYRSEFEGRSALRDGEMMRIGRELSRSTEDELSSDLPAALAAALRQVAPVYRSRFWPMHDRAARLWIAVVEALLSETADELVEAHERVYGVPFPEWIRVDVTPYAGRYGGYTTNLDGEVHTRISCLDESMQGFASLELMFHEPSHGIVGPSFGAIGPEIAGIEKRLHRVAPRQLWHAILFHTSGELTRRALARRGVTSYVPFFVGMFEGPYRREADALREHWQAFLDGRTERGVALERIVHETAESSGRDSADR